MQTNQAPTLYAQIKDAMAALGAPVAESQKLRLHTVPGMWPMNGSAEVDGRITHDFFCEIGGGVIVVKAE